jgi:hypothetical protein
VKPTALQLLSAARDTRELVDDFAATVTYCPVVGKPTVALLHPEEPGQIATVVTDALRHIRREAGPASWIAFTADAYVILSTATVASEIRPGSLASLFAAGDPRVREQMSVLVVYSDGTIEAASQTYRWTPTDGWEWDEPMSIVESKGGVLETLKQFV